MTEMQDTYNLKIVYVKITRDLQLMRNYDTSK